MAEEKAKKAYEKEVKKSLKAADAAVKSAKRGLPSTTKRPKKRMRVSEPVVEEI